MQLHCLGTTGYHPSPTRHTACYYLPELAIVLDAGTGLFRMVEQLRSAPRESLDILLSHAHLDHVVGLSFLLDLFATTTLKKIRLLGTSDKLQAVQNHLFHPLLFPVPLDVEFVPLEEPEGTIDLAHCKLHYFPLEHPGGSIGMVLETDAPKKRVAYITDTTPNIVQRYLDKLVSLDLLLHECYFGDDQQALSQRTGHSWLGAVTENVTRLKPKQTLLIHINPLAEVLNQPIELQSQHRNLKMQFASDCMTVDF